MLSENMYKIFCDLNNYCVINPIFYCFMVNIIFVCLGNICRSPMAEGIFKKLVAQAGLADQIHIDSAGTSAQHSGSLPDSRMRGVALQHNIELESRSRKFTPKDFGRFDYVVAMDDENVANIRAMQPENDKTAILKMRTFDNDSSAADVHDPYYDTLNGFMRCYDVLAESCENFLVYLKKNHFTAD